MLNSFVDFHTHIMPALDHGSKSMEESATQISLFIENGINEVVATSHFYGHVHKLDDFLTKREVAYEQVKSYIDENHLNFKVHLAAEVLAFAGLDNLDRLSELTIGKSSTLLLELPYGPLSSDIEATIVKLIRKGYGILLAHADRYSVIDIEKLISAGAKVQLNASALSKMFVKGAYKRWIAEGTCVALGSDIHGTDAVAIAKFVKATKRLVKYQENFISYKNTLIP